MVSSVEETLGIVRLAGEALGTTGIHLRLRTIKRKVLAPLKGNTDEVTFSEMEAEDSEAWWQCQSFE